MLGLAVLFVSNRAGLRNMTEHWLHAWNGVSYRGPVFRSTETR